MEEPLQNEASILESCKRIAAWESFVSVASVSLSAYRLYQQEAFVAVTVALLEDLGRLMDREGKRLSADLETLRWVEGRDSGE